MLKPAQYTEFIARETADFEANQDWIKLTPVINFQDNAAWFGSPVEIIIMFIGWFMLMFPFPINLIGMILFFVCLIIYKIFGKIFASRQSAIVLDADIYLKQLDKRELLYYPRVIQQVKI